VVARNKNIALWMILWLLLLFFFWLGVPVVEAFPYQPPTPASTSTTFRYPRLPVDVGVRNIHTMELLETIGKDYIRIRHVGQPVRYGGFVTISAELSLRNNSHTILALSRPDQAHLVTFMCLRDNVQRAAFHLRVTQLGKTGHMLAVETTVFSCKRVVDRDIRPLMRFLAFLDVRARYNSAAPNQHPNLMWYRRMVLGLG
jgi:hypothetical protein